MKLFLVLLLSVGLIMGLLLVARATNFFGRASGVPANLLVDTGSSFAVADDAWKNLAQGGEENGRMLQPVLAQVTALAPKYIRIDHVFDYYVDVAGSSGNFSFNFTKLDKYISDIQATGAKPFISLSYMPPALSGGSVTDNPINWLDWERLITATIEHYSGRNNLAISNVYYEVWNEPDIFGGYKINGNKSYLDLYYHTAVGASRAQNTLIYKFGGPASTGLYKNWLEGLVKFASSNNLRLDFLSWHQYSKNLDDYENDYIDARSWLLSYPAYKDAELIISELGPNSENDKVYDGNLSAIHTLATTAMLEGNISKLFNFEIKDGPGGEKYWGRWGILTHEKWGTPEAKPRYNALKFLNNMKGNKVNVAGMGSWVKAFAKNDEKTIRLMVVNYDARGTHNETVPIKLINLPYPKFNLKQIKFGGGTSVTIGQATNGVWQTLENFEPNTASIYEITPLNK